MNIAAASTATARARVESEASMAMLDKTLDTAKANASRLLEALPAADPAKGRAFDGYA